jgi:thiamine transport system substrate-binding protein
MKHLWCLGALIGALAVSACSTVGDTGSDSDQDDIAGGTVVLVTHDSFNVSGRVLRAFELSSGLDVKIRRPGDAGTLVNQLVLTKDAPLGDVAYGIDNTFASRALNEEVLVPYESPALPEGVEELLVDDTSRLSPVDFGDVCINADLRWFTDHDLPVPETLQDLADPAYEGLLVVSDPATSSPGLAFLIGTVVAFGEQGWLDYWERLRDNGVKVANGWSDAYYVDFSGLRRRGTASLVLSYASSPPSEVGRRQGEPTRALLDDLLSARSSTRASRGCGQPEARGRSSDFLLSPQFQSDLARADVRLPGRPRGRAAA